MVCRQTDYPTPPPSGRTAARPPYSSSSPSRESCRWMSPELRTSWRCSSSAGVKSLVMPSSCRTVHGPVLNPANHPGNHEMADLVDDAIHLEVLGCLQDAERGSA